MNFRIKTSANSHETATSKFEKGKNVFISKIRKKHVHKFQEHSFYFVAKNRKNIRVTHI